MFVWLRFVCLLLSSFWFLGVSSRVLLVVSSFGVSSRSFVARCSIFPLFGSCVFGRSCHVLLLLSLCVSVLRRAVFLWRVLYFDTEVSGSDVSREMENEKFFVENF